MSPVLARIAFLALGFAAVELGLPAALARGMIGDWALTAIGLLLVIAGSAGFIGPLLGGEGRKGDIGNA